MCIKINYQERALVNTKTADLVRPSCFDTLTAYDSYLRGVKRGAEADEILKKVFKGEKVISDMIQRAQEQGLVKK